MSEGLDTWTILEPAFDVRHNRHYEGLMAIGSGPLQQRASLEGGFADDPQDREFLRLMANVTVERFPDFKGRFGTYMPGVTGPHPTCGDQLINLPALHGLVLFAGHERLDMESSRISDYRRQLDLRTAHLTRACTWQTSGGARLAVRFERFISAHRRHVMALRCRVRHLGGPPAELRILGTLDADVRTNGFDHFQQIAFTGEHEPITVEVRTNGGDRVAAAAVMSAAPGIIWSIETEPRWAAITGVHFLEPGRELTLCKFAAMTSSRHVRGAPLDAVRNMVWDALGTGFERLALESDEVWRRRWEQTDVEIAGDPRSQLALRIALYHLLRAAPELDPRVAIDPRAASGEAYCGRYFWDTEMFMLPVFLYTRPEIGRSLAAFRASSLDGARRNARRYGYHGARYAWESAPTGDEQCPNWQYADHEVHVTADVAYGLWHAHLGKPEEARFLARVTEVLTETARYWRERVVYSAERDEYDMLMVMGPDEYTPFCRNNAYTNYLVAQMLSCTGQAWSELRRLSARAADELAVGLGLHYSELEAFAAIAGKLHFPYDAARRLVLQSDDFASYEEFDLERWWPDRTQPLGRQVSQERLYRSQVLKQADVLQLLALFPQQFDAEQMRAAYEAYAPLTCHDSSLSRCVHAMVAAWIGRADDALRFWDASVGLDLDAPNAAEGVHAACAGGNWQAAILGFGGVRTQMQSEVLSIEPHLPQRWTALRFPFVWRGQPLHISISHDEVTITHRGTAPLEARVCGQALTLAPGSSNSVAQRAQSAHGPHAS